MISAGNLSLAVIILGPVAWRKYASWRHEKARSSSTESTAIKHKWLSFPSPIYLPSNLLLTFAFLTLVYIHLSYLFQPSKALYRSDLFLLTKANVTTSVANIRSKVASMTFEELGWRREWGEEGLETLLRRLSSFEGRKLHLTIGTRPFLSCQICSSTKDYMLFSLSDRLWQLSINLILFGLLTCRFDSLEVFDESVFSLLQMVTRRDLRPAPAHLVYRTDAPTMLLRPHGYGYRTPLLYLMGLYALALISVYLGFVEVTFGQGRWDHWHANSSIAFHSVLLAASIWIYLGQRIPKMPAMLEIANLIKYSRIHTDQTLAHVQAMHLTNQIIWSDVGLRQRVANWYDARRENVNDLTSDRAIDNLYARAESSGVNASSIRNASKMTAKSVWSGTQASSQEWERTLALQHTTISEPSTPLAMSLSQ